MYLFAKWFQKGRLKFCFQTAFLKPLFILTYIACVQPDTIFFNA